MNRKQSDRLMMIIITLTIMIVILTYFVKINSVVHGQGV
ncbi:type-I secretion protein, partial [Salmonella enterica subsp. diarizonae]|nr:type-I secretion protein [Salmonella enterica subsp. diarizonae]EDH3728946.1 type-I secretion protein [Salmonella enterica subsp. diarizonae]